MDRSNALTGSDPEPRAIRYGPQLTCPECATRREYLRCASEAQLAPGRAYRSPFGWEAVCGNCGDDFTLRAG
jgi:hypothetical protein